MADVYCPKCGEPVDIWEFNDVAQEKGYPVSTIRENFFRDGCEALGFRCNPDYDPEMAEISAIAYDIMGDDLDGISAMTEDYEFIRRYK